MAWTYNEETQVYTVEVGELESLLTSLPANSVDSPYKMEITQLTESDVYNSSTKYEPGYGGKLGWSISKCKKYVDLSPTVFTQNIRYSKCFLFCDYLVVAPTFYWEAEEPFFVLRGTFYGCRNLKTLPNLPDINTTLDMAFYNCSSLESIPTLPSKCNGIESCFYGCSSLTTIPELPSSGYSSVSNLYYGCTNLTHVPEFNCKTITNASGCFGNCVALEEIPDLPDTVTDINWCFYNCLSLVNPPQIPANTTSMNDCFRGCESLVETPHIPESVKTMERCFYDCTSLIEVKNIPSKIERMSEAFYNSGIIKTPLLPEKVEYSDAYGSYSGLYRTFKDCKNLVEITNIPSETEVFAETFVNCISLKEVPELSNKVKSISFNGCTSLKTITNIPASRIIVLLDQCTSLETVKMWDFSDTGVASEVYLGDCTSLKYIGVENCGKEVLLDNYLEDNRTRFRIPDSVDIKLLITPIDNRIPFPQLEEYLAYKSENTADNPYSLNITELTDSDLDSSNNFGTLGYILRVSINKFVDLRDTLLPDTISSLFESFYDVNTLVYSPSIPESVVDMRSTFASCYNLLYIPKLPTVIDTMNGCFRNCQKIKYATGLPNTAQDFKECFSGCDSLESIDKLPITTSLNDTFHDCTNLINVPEIPEGVINIQGAFFNCQSLKTVEKIPSSAVVLTDAFGDCKELKTINTWILNDDDSLYYIGKCFDGADALESIYVPDLYTEQKMENFLELWEWEAGITFNIKEVVKPINNTVEYTDLGNYLWLVPQNDDETPYDVNILNIPAIAVTGGELRTIIFNNDKYLNLGTTVLPDVTDMSYAFVGTYEICESPKIPDTVTNLTGCFSGTSLDTLPELPSDIQILDYAFGDTLIKEIPSLPNTVTSMKGTFKNCSELTSAVLPSGVTNVSECFSGCKKLTQPPLIPNTVSDAAYMFKGCKALTKEAEIPPSVASYEGIYQDCSAIETINNVPAGKTSYKNLFNGCSALTTIYGFELSYEDLNNGVYDTTDMFKGCTSLADIFIDKPTLTESDSWKLVRIDAESDTASVYSSEGVLEYTVPVSVDKYKKYELEGYIDEIVVAESGQITDEIIEKFFKYQKPFTNDPSKSLNPADANFVLWAKDPDSVVSNILNGGGGGSALVPSITQDEYDKIPNKMDGQIREIIDATEEEPFINVLYEQAPIGSFFPFGGDSAPIGFLMCKGQEVSREAYADLFAVIGTKYGEGDGETTFNLPNITDEAKLDIEYMTGKRDTDGRPIYLKIYKSITTTSASNWGNVSNDVIENVQNIKNGYISRADKSGYSCLLRISGNRLQCYIANAGISVNDLVTVEYTKTTDTADTFCYKQIDGSTYCIKSTKTSGELAPDIEVDDNKVTNTNVMSAQKTMETLGFELGSNENGFYRKWANGLLECWGRVEGTFNHETNYTYNLPISYIGNASVSLTPNKLTDTSNNETMHGDIVDGNILTIRHHRAGGGTYIGAISYFAIGFWK